MIDVFLDRGIADVDPDGDVAEFVGLADGEVDDAPKGGLFLQSELEGLALPPVEEAIASGIEDLLIVEKLGEAIEAMGPREDILAPLFDLGVREEVGDSVDHAIDYFGRQHWRPDLHVDAVDHG